MIFERFPGGARVERTDERVVTPLFLTHTKQLNSYELNS